MLSVTFATLRSQFRRFIAPALAIIIGVAFVSTTLTLGATVDHSTQKAIGGDLGSYAVVVAPAKQFEGGVPAKDLEKVKAVAGVTHVDAVRRTAAQVTHAHGTSYASIMSQPSAHSRARLLEGSYPAKDNEAAISKSFVAGTDAAIGSKISIGTASFTVSGVVDTAPDPRLAGLDAVVLTSASVAKVSENTDYRELLVSAAPTTDPSALRDAVQKVTDRSTAVRTGEEAARAEVVRVSGGSKAMTTALTAFALISLFVSGLVIANTFTILLARRRRETALLRSIGATRTQVVRSSLLESFLVGLVSSVIGTGIGIGLTSVIAGFGNRANLGIPMTDLAISPTSLALPIIVGTVITVLAAVPPVRRAAKVAPLEALRPTAEVSVRSAVGVLRIALGVLLIAGGTFLMITAGRAKDVFVGVGGGALSFLGVLVLGSVLVPALVRLTGWLPAKVLGVPGRLAVENSVRNRGRAAATASALLIGVTLIATMVVGAASTTASLTKLMDREFAVDLSISSPQGVADEKVTELAQINGVRANAKLSGAQVDVGTGLNILVSGVSPSAQQTLRNAQDSPLTKLEPGQLVIDSSLASGTGIMTGQPVLVKGPKGEVTLSPKIIFDGKPSAYVTEEDLLTVSATSTSTVWLRLSDDADLGSVMPAVTKITSSIPEVQVAGGAPIRAEMQRIIDIMLLVVTGLLGVSILIAIVGIGNTLSLSALERTKESALLRALGLTKGQLRATLAVEAGLLATVGALLGSALGIVYGWAGQRSLFGEKEALVLDIPWDRLGMIAGGALLCGLLAAVLPARRAAKVSPAAALAQE